MQFVVSTVKQEQIQNNYLETNCNHFVQSNYSPIHLSVSVVNAMKLVFMIPIKGCEPPAFLTWSKKVFSDIEKLTGTYIHILFDNYAYSFHYQKIERVTVLKGT